MGRLRGVVYDPMMAEYSGWQDYLVQLGLEPDYANVGRAIEIDGHTYLFARHYNNVGMILTTNPEFW